MQFTVNCILLIEDDEATNFFHQIILKKIGFTGNVQVAKDGKKAIDYLKQAAEGKHPIPNLIFLDINMPVMNGWEFLEKYRSLPLEMITKIVVIILTSSPNPADEKKAKLFTEVAAFMQKPLTADMLLEVMNAYFK